MSVLLTAIACQSALGTRETPDPTPDSDSDAADTEVDDSDDTDPVDSDTDPVVVWQQGTLDGTPPATSVLLELPGGGDGPPVLTSNNPEAYTGPGLLYGNARPTVTRGGTAYPLSGEFGVYLHHLNDSGAATTLWLMVTNPNDVAVTVDAAGSGYTQTETGGMGLGQSPDYRVSREWILGLPNTVVTSASIEPYKPLAVWQRSVNDGAEADGRFWVQASLPVYVYVVATETDDINDAVWKVLEDAPGDYRISGTPPPPYGREAGIYEHDTWLGALDLDVPAGPVYRAYMVNTATGTGLSQVQAFPALVHLDGSAAESVGMYGNVYDLTATLRHDGEDANTREVRVSFASLSTGNVSRYWDGVALVDGVETTIRHVPGDVTTVLAELSLDPGEEVSVQFQAMVPGLTSIPQAFVVESL